MHPPIKARDNSQAAVILRGSGTALSLGFSNLTTARAQHAWR